MKDKLLRCEEFVMSYLQDDDSKQLSNDERVLVLFRYAEFMNQKLTERYAINGVYAHPFNRFLPVDLEGNILKEPKDFKHFMDGIGGHIDITFQEYKDFQNAKERVLFKGLTLDKLSPFGLSVNPCDFNGNVLTKSSMSDNTCEEDCNHKVCVEEMNECIKYQEAKERVLFEGNWKHLIDDRYMYMNWMTDLDSPKKNNKHERTIKMHECKIVEDLIKYDLTLTKSAINQLN